MAIDLKMRRALRAMAKTLSKRPRTVLERILAKGSVSTFELGKLGYDQPPRAAQDLKEAGVLLETTFGKHPVSGARMAIYSFKGLQDGVMDSGRRPLPKKFREEIIAASGKKCNICNVVNDARVLQIDHRVPFIVGGEAEQLSHLEFQPLCGSHQRLKSWSCEHCPNRDARRDEVCRSCYWAIPEGDYTHVATRSERRVDITWSGDAELGQYRALEAAARKAGVPMPIYLKRRLG